MIVAGVLGLVVDGVAYATEETAKYSSQKREYSDVSTGNGFAGVEGKGVSPYVETTVKLDQGQSVDDLAVQDVIVILRCEDRAVTLSGAFQVGKLENDAAKNAVQVKFCGTDVFEVFA